MAVERKQVRIIATIFLSVYVADEFSEGNFFFLDVSFEYGVNYKIKFDIIAFALFNFLDFVCIDIQCAGNYVLGVCDVSPKITFYIYSRFVFARGLVEYRNRFDGFFPIFRSIVEFA